jgi:hypothetical protein
MQDTVDQAYGAVPRTLAGIMGSSKLAGIVFPADHRA